MQKPRPSKTVQFAALLLLVAAMATIFGCRNKQAAEPAPAGATQAQPLSKQQIANSKQQRR